MINRPPSLISERRAEPGTDVPSSAPLVDVSRRRLFQGVAGGAGVLLSVQAKSALGQQVACQSPSAMMSGNLSRPANAGGSCSGGLSPGYWRQPQHFGAWRAAKQTPPELSGVVVECGVNGLGQLGMEHITAPGTTFQEVFGGTSPMLKATNGETAVNPCSLWAVLAFHNDFVDGTFLFHMAAAWLNANYFLGAAATYPLTPAQVQQMFADTVNGGLYNGQVGWDKNFVVGYISGMYDFNAPVPNYCVVQQNG